MGKDLAADNKRYGETGSLDGIPELQKTKGMASYLLMCWL